MNKANAAKRRAMIWLLYNGAANLTMAELGAMFGVSLARIRGILSQQELTICRAARRARAEAASGSDPAMSRLAAAGAFRGLGPSSYFERSRILP